MKKLLHVGSGPAGNEAVHHLFRGSNWEHVRVDIDPDVKPDVVDDIRTLKNFENASADGVYSSHNLEHLHFNDVHVALKTFYRVLKPGGRVFITMPDLALACQFIASGDPFTILYHSPAGPITPIDVVFGYRPWTYNNPHQQHRCGFTKDVLEQLLFDCGFCNIQVIREKNTFALWCMASKPDGVSGTTNDIEPAIKKLADEVDKLTLQAFEIRPYNEETADEYAKQANRLSEAVKFLDGSQEDFQYQPTT